MRILVLGGTRFVGRAVVDQAVSRGYDVTTFNRGRHGEPRPGAVALHGDRTRHEDLRPLAGQDWDAVIDTSVLAPAHVTASARLLAGHAGRYMYVSSVSAYSGWPAGPVTEESATFSCPPDAAGSQESLGYGPLKAGSERAVAGVFPGQHLIVRPGLIAGPHDNVGRLPWWLARFARGGRMLAPGEPGRPVRLTDARDLAAWMLDSARRKITGTVNVPGPRGCAFADLMAACAEVTGASASGTPASSGPATSPPAASDPASGAPAASSPAPSAPAPSSPAPSSPAPSGLAASGLAAELVWAPDEVLLAARVEPLDELPMWLPDQPELAGTWEISGERARLAGMRYRPLIDTVRDTWAWLSRAMAAGGLPALALMEGVGLDPEREQEILARL